jgi:hypothetical protein
MTENQRRQLHQLGDAVHFGVADAACYRLSVPQPTHGSARRSAINAIHFLIDGLQQARHHGVGVGALVDRDVIVSCLMPGVRELPPSNTISYRAFVDPSGGSSDSMTLAIAHHDGMRDSCVIDALREHVPPFSPESVVAEMAQLLRSYNVSSVTGDRYGGEWPRESFSRHNISYELSAMTKSQLYAALLPLLNSARIELLDSGRLISQLANLERRTARGGRDSIDHPQGQHDDVGNVVAGVAAITIASSGYSLETYRRAFGDAVPAPVPYLPGEDQPTSGILQPGAVDLGSGGYHLPTYQERLEMVFRARQQIEQKNTHAQIRKAFTEAEKNGTPP